MQTSAASDAVALIPVPFLPPTGRGRGQSIATAPRRTRAGFTLVEMTVVTAILAMMAALVVPNLVSLKRSRDIRDAEAALSRLPVEARNEARKAGVPVTLRIEGDAIVMERPVTIPSSTGGVPEEDGTVEETRRVRFAQDVEVEAARLRSEDIDPSVWIWQVYPDGTAEEAALTFREGERRRTLTLPVDAAVLARWTDGEMPPAEIERWPAGEVEQRVPGF